MAAAPIRLSSLPPLGGLGLGALAAAGVGLAPAGWLEGAVELGGVALLIPAAAAPLGGTARALIAGGAGLFCGATAWAALFLLFGPGGAFAREGGEEGMPTVRRADAHPDAPPRRPLAAAAELGAPPPPALSKADVPPAAAEPPDECALPADLDQPLSRFDPGAVRLEPMAAGRPVPPLAIKREPLGPGERIESVELPAPAPAESAAPPSIHALLARLERGAGAERRLRRAG